MIIVKKLKRLPNKIKRKILQFPILKFVSEFFYKKELKKYVNYLPKIYPEDFTLIDSLRQEGVFVTYLQTLEISSTSLLIVSAKKLLPELLLLPSNGKYSISLSSCILMNYPEIFLWGLEERLINIVENYIGLPIMYHGVDFRREIANGKPINVRQWHIDIEDYRMVKIIVYLNNVSLNGGPFEYISKSLTSSLSQALKYSAGFVSDQVIESFVAKSDWNSCVGQDGTVIFTDTCNVFHRAKPPVEADRFSLTFAYTSRQPITMFTKSALHRDELQRISSKLNKRQRECILGYRNSSY
ncbi:hypothetical protein QUB80_22575 [Chlorogloeopsis sp. ULAP01]|jgi:hypothetical protein|nr:hypothetical protein [Chlorogloeopsis sp. ULAP01]